MAISIDDGGLVIKDPLDARVYTFDWDILGNLAPTVQLASVGTFTITVLDGANTTPLTKDNESLVAGNRKTQLRLSAGTPGTKYKIENQIVTTETVPQTKNRLFYLKIEDQ